MSKEINELKSHLDTMIGNSSQLKAEKLVKLGYRRQSELLIKDFKSNNSEVMSNKQIDEMAKDICHLHNCEAKKQGKPCYKYCKAHIYAFRAINANYRKIPDNIGDFSDGYHTFNELYHHRAVLFSVICNMMPERAWKSKLHDTGDMFDGMFIVGIETEQGQATYHYDIEPYWDMFKVKELEKAPKWDGHTPSDAIQRIGSISSKQSEGEWITSDIPQEKYVCSVCGGACWYYDYQGEVAKSRYCPNCGSKMKGGAE